MAQHRITTRTYLGVFAALLALTGVTTGVAYIDLGVGPLNTIVALALASGKTLLVVLYFMHVIESERLIAVAAAAGLFWVALLLVLAGADYVTREWQGWEPMPVGERLDRVQRGF